MSKTNEDRFPAPASRMCFWYYKGVTGMEPRVAIITSVAKGGVLELTIFSCGQTTITTASGVRHKDDPYIAQRPMHAVDCGCWDYLPGQAPKPTQSLAARPDRTEVPPNRKFSDAKI